MSMPASHARRPQTMPSMPVADDEVLEGVPDARGVFTAESEDEGACAGYWSCEVGRYEFFFDYDEFVFLIEGEVRIVPQEPPGQPFTLQPGDSAHFPQGVTTVWEVTRRMTKYFVARAPY